MPVDAQERPLYSTLGDDFEFGDAVEQFVEEMPGRIEHLEDLLELRDWDSLQQAAAHLKQTACEHGFIELRPPIQRLERELEHRATGRLPSLREAATALIDACRRVRAG